MKRQTFINISIAFILIIVVLSLYYTDIYFLQSFENKTYDLRFRLRGDIPHTEDIAIIAIDEKSIGELGRFPWTRKHYADLIDIVRRAGAKALLFDAFFPERESKKADALFADSISRSEIVTLPVVIEFSKEGSVINVIKNIPPLQSSAKNISHINMSPDEDGVVRRTPLMIQADKVAYPSLGLIGASEALGSNKIDTGDYVISLGSRNIPVDTEGKMLINYSGPEGIYKRYSFSDVLRGRVSKDELRGKILLIGATAIGIYDLRVTPFSNNTPGVEVNANIIDTIIRGNFIKRDGISALIDIFLISALILLTYLVTFSVRALIALPFVIILIVGYVYLSYWMFLDGEWISMVYPLIGIILSFSISASTRFFVVEKKAKKIRLMFSSYVSKKVVDELVRHPEKAKVGGEKKLITVLFTDVRGYTTFSEKHTPEEVVSRLNEFLSEMTNVIIQYDGTLDKFLGDGILAFWGAPIEQEDHPQLAVRCAIAMLKQMETLKARWLSEGKEPLECGMGINTGEAIVGNIGVEGKKIDYTAIGDTVNLAHRLQTQSRGVMKPVISGTLYQKVKDIVDVEYLGEVTVKGRQGSVGVYAINSLKV